jgi:hypothetical protein
VIAPRDGSAVVEVAVHSFPAPGSIHAVGYDSAGQPAPFANTYFTHQTDGKTASSQKFLVSKGQVLGWQIEDWKLSGALKYTLTFRYVE